MHRSDCGSGIAESSDGDVERAIDMAKQKGQEIALQKLVGVITRKIADGIVCFVAGTPVETPEGPVAIETLALGDRVTSASDDAAPATVIDPSRWRQFNLIMRDDQEGGTGSEIQISLLRPSDWFGRPVVVGDRVELAIGESGVRGIAQVLAVAPCPTIKQGPGRLVLMKTTTLYRGDMASVKFNDPCGASDVLTGTAGHPIYSLDRGAYVPLGDLQPSERVRTADGWATVESLARIWTDATVVHNVEVDAAHRYSVGVLRLDCHNDGPCNGALRGVDGRFATNPNKPVKPEPNGVHGNTAGSQYAERYELYDKDGNFLKHGVSQNAATRYSRRELAGGSVIKVESGPRRQMLDNERRETERNPGPLNFEPWAGSKRPK